MTDLSMTIGGERRQGPTSFGVVNPATGEVHGRAPECSPEQLDAAFSAARDAYRTWRTDDDRRRELLLVAAEALKASVDDLAPLLTAEQGKPLRDAQREVIGARAWLRYYAEIEVGPEVIQDDERALAQVVRRPMGVVAAITPWNFPLVLASWKLGPALRAGNTVVLKPSPYTPLSSLRLGEILNEVLPPGVVNVVSGGDRLGSCMTSHPVPRKLTFTGSVRTGMAVAAAAAPDLKRVTLELGGNDAAILLDDIEPAAVVDDLFDGAFANNGQVCSAIKRLYVPERRHDELVEALSARARAAVVGNGMDPGTDLGPINNALQRDRVQRLVSEALDSGATAVAGGRPLEGGGYFFEPTILTGATEGTAIVDEEQFGPALPVLPYRNVEEAIERANGTSFGLSGSVWGRDEERVAAVADRMECGTVWVNAHLALAPHQPFGGFKWSGVGVENGPWGIDSFTELQVQYRRRR